MWRESSSERSLIPWVVLGVLGLATGLARPVRGWRALNRLAVPFFLGWAILAVGLLQGRLLAPFHGTGLFFYSALSTLMLGAVALGVLAAGGTASGERRIAPALLVSGVWCLGVPFVHRTLLGALEPLGLHAALVLGALVLSGPPVFLLGAALGTLGRAGAASGEDRGRGFAACAAASLLGAALAAPIVGFLLVPSVGIARAWLMVATLLIMQAGAVLFASRRRAAGVTALIAAALAAAWTARAPAARLTPAPGAVLCVKDGPLAEFRVLDREGSRYLLVDGTIHSVVESDRGVSLHRAAAALELTKLLFANPDTVLVLGLRGGSVAQSFARDGWVVVAVDADPTAPGIAARYFALRPEQARVTVMDPRVFTRRDHSRYPLVILDSFADSSIPPHLVTHEFFGLLRARLDDGGVVALIVEAQGWDDVLVRSLAETLRGSFRHVIALPTGEPPNVLGSLILLGSDRPIALSDEIIPRPSDFVADPYAHWVVVQMSHAWANQFEPERSDARSLSDDDCPVDLWSDRINRTARTELHQFFGRRAGAW